MDRPQILGGGGDQEDKLPFASARVCLLFLHAHPCVVVNRRRALAPQWSRGARQTVQRKENGEKINFIYYIEKCA